MEGCCIKSRNRNLFLPLNNQVDEHMKIHGRKLKEYENYLNSLHSTIVNISMTNHPIKAFHIPPPTPVTLAFSHLASPNTNPFCHINQDYFMNNFQEPFVNIYAGKEVNIWGPGQLGLFAKTPNQLEALSITTYPSLDHKSSPMPKNKPTPVQISDAARLQDLCISSPKSSMSPGFEHKCSLDISRRDEMLVVNR